MSPFFFSEWFAVTFYYNEDCTNESQFLRWFVNLGAPKFQIERKIPTKDVITRYKILLYKKKFYLSSLNNKIILIFFYPFNFFNFSIYDKVFVSLSKQLQSGDNFGNTLSELDIDDPVSLSQLDHFISLKSGWYRFPCRKFCIRQHHIYLW